jgi:transposase
MNAERNREVVIKPYNCKELASLYNVDRRTFARWIKKFEVELGEKQGYFFSISQVKIIFGKLSLPE